MSPWSGQGARGLCERDGGDRIAVAGYQPGRVMVAKPAGIVCSPRSLAIDRFE
jgi:hypothetical protein